MNVAQTEIDKLGGLKQVILTEFVGPGIGHPTHEKALIEAARLSAEVETEHKEVKENLAQGAYKIWSDRKLNIPRIVASAMDSMLLGAVTGIILDKILSINFSTAGLGIEFYAVFGALQGLLNYAREHNIPVNLVDTLVSGPSSLLLLSFMSKDVTNYDTKLLIPYGILAPLTAGATIRLIELFGGYTAFLKQCHEELKPSSDKGIKMAEEVLTKWAQKLESED